MSAGLRGGWQFQIQTLTQSHFRNGPANSESLSNPETGNSFKKVSLHFISFVHIRVYIRVCVPWWTWGDQRTTCKSQFSLHHLGPWDEAHTVGQT